MFNFDEQIRSWRRQMLAAGVKSPTPLDELESHLREDIERGLRQSFTIEQAFEAAAQRLGPSKALEAEFAKMLNEKQERRLKLLCLALTGVAYLLPFVLSALKPWSRMTPTEQLFGLSAITFTLVSMFIGVCLYRFLPVIPDKRFRTRVQFASAAPLFLWLCVFAFVILPRIEMTVNQMTIGTLWAISPLALFGGLIAGLDEAARRRKPYAPSQPQN